MSLQEMNRMMAQLTSGRHRLNQAEHAALSEVFQDNETLRKLPQNLGEAAKRMVKNVSQAGPEIWTVHQHPTEFREAVERFLILHQQAMEESKTPLEQLKSLLKRVQRKDAMNGLQRKLLFNAFTYMEPRVFGNIGDTLAWTEETPISSPKTRAINKTLSAWMETIQG